MHSLLSRRALASLQADTCLACFTSRRYSSKGSWEWRREKTPWRNVEAWNQEPRMYSHRSYNQVFNIEKAQAPPKEPKGPKRPIGRPRKEQTSDLGMLLSSLITKCSIFENPSSKGAKNQNEYVLSSLIQLSIQYWKTLAPRPKIARKPRPIRRKHLLNNLALQLTSGLP